MNYIKFVAKVISLFILSTHNVASQSNTLRVNVGEAAFKKETTTNTDSITRLNIIDNTPNLKEILVMLKDKITDQQKLIENQQGYIENQQSLIEDLENYIDPLGPIFLTNYTFAGPQQITRSSLYEYDALIISPPTDYSLKFAIEPKGKVGGRYTNIMHFTQGGGCCDYGQRVPGIWFSPNTTKLFVCTGDNSNGNICAALDWELELNKEYTIEVRVVGSNFTVLVDNMVEKEMNIGDRDPIDKVNVFIGDPWSSAANAIISDISFTEVP